MARETRSQTGNSKPRVAQVVDTAPTITRKSAPKKKAVKPEAKGAKPTGVTKKKAAPKKEGVAAKAKAAVKKVTKKAEAAETDAEETVEKAEKAEKTEKVEKEVKPKTTKKKETPVAK